MKQSSFDKGRDKRIANTVIEHDRALMCPAHGCPRPWNVQGDRGRACSAHYWASHRDWPAITEQLQREVVERALARNNEKETTR